MTKAKAKSKQKHRKHYLKQFPSCQPVRVAGLATVAAGALALAGAPLVQADEQSAATAQVAVTAVEAVSVPQAPQETGQVAQSNGTIEEAPVTEVDPGLSSQASLLASQPASPDHLQPDLEQTATVAKPTEAQPAPAVTGNVASIAMDTTYTKPVNGPVSAGFEGYPGHGGIDFAVPEGTPVHAARDGVVTIAQANHSWMGWQGGNAVLIQHEDGMHTGYAHLSQINVQVGQKVKQGEVIGLSGSTGLVTGPHLHFEFLPANPDFSNGHSGRIDGTAYIINSPYKAEPTPDTYNPQQLAAQVGQTLSDGDYHIVLDSNEKFGIDANGAGKTNGTNIQLYQNSKDDQQIFTVTYLGGGFYKLTHKASGKVLDIDSGSNKSGANVQLWDYTGSAAQQFIIKQSDGNDSFEIVSRNSGLALDVNGGTVANGTNIRMYEPNQSKAQQFKFISVDKDAKRTIADGDYHITSTLNDKLGLNITGAGTVNNTNVTLYPNVNDSKQIFTVKYIGNGYYSVKSRFSGKSLDVSGGSAYNRANVAMYDVNNTDAQQWIIKPSNFKGAYEIVAKHKNKVLDVDGGSTKPETNVQLYTRNGSKAQAWNFVPVKKVKSE